MSVVHDIQEEIAELQRRLKRIQDECSHPKDCTIKKGASNTGNYCPQDDSYWYDCYCELCNKRWTEDQ